MTLSGKQASWLLWRQAVYERWSRTPGYLKWAAGILLGAVLRLLLEKWFPETWKDISRVLIDPKVPVWIALLGIVVALVLQRSAPSLYRGVRARTDQSQLHPLFGVLWATPPHVEQVQGPYCPSCNTALRGALWSGDSSPTLWICPGCSSEFATPEFPDIRIEVEQQLGGMKRLPT